MKITFVALAALVIVGVASYADAAMPGMSQEQTQKLLAAERAARFVGTDPGPWVSFSCSHRLFTRGRPASRGVGVSRVEP